jgi:acetylornithine deacetylase/succinyl-diaminopimelate desuccinylase-like protein
MQTAELTDYIERHRDNAIQELIRFASQPSVSARGEGIEECAQLAKEMLERRSISARILKRENANPLVYGEIKSKRNPSKTIIFYNHYDVQPPEPLELWESPPFKPSLRNGKLYGRGVSDDKGELVSRINATEALLQTEGDVPCNLRFVFEGEEEIGSTHLHEYLQEYPELTQADAVLWEFGGVNAKDTPEIILGVKGILYVELTAHGANRDAHSSIGAIVQNPAWRLVWALNTLKDSSGKILIPGWYDDVRPFGNEEEKLLDAEFFDEEAYKKDLGIDTFMNGMTGLELKKAKEGAPTCTICGLYSGYTGKGSKTVLPSTAMAKIDFRLVPEQGPEDLTAKLQQHLEKTGFSDISVTYSEGEPAARTDPKQEIVRAAATAAKQVYGTEPVIVVSSAATGPMHLFKPPKIAIGCAYPFVRQHSPNEHLRIDLFAKGTRWVAETISNFAAS